MAKVFHIVYDCVKYSSRFSIWRMMLLSCTI